MTLLDNLLLFIYFTSQTRGLKNISVLITWSGGNNSPCAFTQRLPLNNARLLYHRLDKVSLSDASRSPMVSLFILRLKDKSILFLPVLPENFRKPYWQTKDILNLSFIDLTDQHKLKHFLITFKVFAPIANNTAIHSSDLTGSYPYKN